MSSRNAYNNPTETSAVDGDVTLNGPDGIGLSMTPDAAEETARRLTRAAEDARKQASPSPDPVTNSGPDDAAS